MANGEAHSDLLDPQAFLRIAPLEMVATRIVEGFISGHHRSPYKGGCIEFAGGLRHNSEQMLQL